MKICAKCGKEFTCRSSRYCSLECSGSPSLNKRHGLSGTRLHATWLDMRNRCRNPNYYNYARYGGRGIKICERWEVFENFLTDMGPRPGPEYSIDRIDNDGDYEPTNCKWATKLEQTRNRSNSWTVDEDARLLEGIGKGMNCEQLAEVTGKTIEAVYGRCRRLNVKPARRSRRRA